jgi:hypothetical protein
VDTDKAIGKVLKAFPYNTNFEDVLIKASIINSLYSTNVYAVVKMARHIHSLKIDTAIKKGDMGVVHRIADVEFTTRRFYSFATKYCHWHNPQEFPIYDSYVDKVLWAYRQQEQDKFQPGFARTDMRQYDKFKNILQDFRKAYQLSVDIKKLDKFLFIYGKELFGNQN